MDVQIFSFAIPAIIAAFRISNADAGLIGTVTLLTSAFGGWLAGALSDRFGRVRTLQVTILWFAFYRLIGALVGLTDEQLNSETEPGGWTYRVVAKHTVLNEQDSLKNMREAIACRPELNASRETVAQVRG